MIKRITYRNLLDAIAKAKELLEDYEYVACNTALWRGTPEEQDRAEARLREADNALNSGVWEFYGGEEE